MVFRIIWWPLFQTIQTNYRSGRFSWNRNQVVLYDEPERKVDCQVRTGHPFEAQFMYKAIGTSPGQPVAKKKYDPELNVSNDYPVMKTFAIRANITF